MVDRVRRMGRALPGSETAAYVDVLLAAIGGDARGAQELARELLSAFPASAALHYAVLQPRLAAIAAGQIDPQTAELIRGLPQTAAAVVQGSQHLAQSRYGELSQLESVLAQTRSTDPWYADAILLRAEWRSRVSNAGIAQRLSDEAITMLDRLALVQPSLPLFAIRTRAAINANRPDVLAESAWSVLQWTMATTRPSPEGRARSQTTLRELRRLLDGKDSDPRVDARRLREVRGRIDEAIAKLS